MPKNLIISSAPATDPVTRAECALFMRYSGTLQNDVIDSLIKAATKYVQQWTGRTLVTTTFEFYYDWLLDSLQLPVADCTSITSIYYKDNTDNYTVLTSTLYELDNKSLINAINRKYGSTYPAVCPVVNAVKVTFVSGFGAASAVPDSLKTAVKMMVAQCYENREGLQMSDLKENPTIKQLMNDYTIYKAW